MGSETGAQAASADGPAAAEAGAAEMTGRGEPAIPPEDAKWEAGKPAEGSSGGGQAAGGGPVTPVKVEDEDSAHTQSDDGFGATGDGDTEDEVGSQKGAQSRSEAAPVAKPVEPSLETKPTLPAGSPEALELAVMGVMHSSPKVRSVASEITMEDLSKWFHLPSEQAAKKLGIGLTVLKRQCRKFGIKRWPFRKLKSLDRLMENIQTSVAPSDHNRVLVQSVEELKSQKERMELGKDLELDERTKKLQQAYSKANHKIRRQQQNRPDGQGTVPAVQGKPLPPVLLRGNTDANGEGAPASTTAPVVELQSVEGTYASAMIGEGWRAQIAQLATALNALQPLLAYAQQEQAGDPTTTAAAVTTLAGMDLTGVACGGTPPAAEGKKGMVLGSPSPLEVKAGARQVSPAPNVKPFAGSTNPLLNLHAARHLEENEEASDGTPRHGLEAENRREAERSKHTTRRTLRWPAEDSIRVSDPLSNLADLAELEEEQERSGAGGSSRAGPGHVTPSSRHGRLAAGEEDVGPLTEVDVLARLQIYAQEMGYVLQGTTVLPLSVLSKRKKSSTRSPSAGKRRRQ